MKTRLPLAGLLFCILLPGRAAADPRWWWHDQPVTTSAARKEAPDVALVPATGLAGAGAVFVVWQESGSSGSDIFLDASFDGGCSFCGPVAWAAQPADEREPRLAVAASPAGRYAIQVVYSRAGQVVAAFDQSVPLAGSPADLCRALLAARPGTRLLSRNAAAVDGRPRVDAQARAGRLHFHAVWESSAGGPPPSLHYDADLVGDGSGWAGTSYRDLSLLTGERGDGPDVAVDLNGAGPGDSAVSVTYRDAGGIVQLLRSADSGATWSPRPVTVSGAAAGGPTAIDAGISPAGGPAWVGVAWDPGAGGGPRLDAGLWTGPATHSPDFDPAPGDLSLGGTGSGPALAVGLPDASAGATAALYAFWSGDGDPVEIRSRAGVFDPSDPQPRNLDRVPFAPLRIAPPDPVRSEVEDPFSNCQWDDGWSGVPPLESGSCRAASRPPGSGASAPAASDPSGAGPVPAAFAMVFVDDRSGDSQVYLKLTDTTAPLVPHIQGARPACEAVRVAAAELDFGLADRCPDQAERLDRVLVYYGGESSDGATPAGPFARRLEVPAAGLPVPARATVGGLNAGETYHFALVPEDEARNLNPPDFDPRRQNPTLDPGQVQAGLVMPACLPAVSMSCVVLADDCGGSSDGNYNPGDVVTVRLTFANNGDLDASGLSGQVVATDASVLSPAGGALAVPAVPVSGSTAVDVRIRLGAACPLAPTLGVNGLASDPAAAGGPVSYGSPACAVPLLPVTCSPACTSTSCSAGALAGCLALKGAKGANRDDAVFTWQGDSSALEQHLNRLAAKADIPASRRAPAGVGAPACTAAGGACTLAGAVGAAPAMAYYQAHSACGATGDQEGP